MMIAKLLLSSQGGNPFHPRKRRLLRPRSAALRPPRRVFPRPGSRHPRSRKPTETPPTLQMVTATACHLRPPGLRDCRVGRKGRRSALPFRRMKGTSSMVRERLRADSAVLPALLICVARVRDAHELPMLIRSQSKSSPRAIIRRRSPTTGTTATEQTALPLSCTLSTVSSSALDATCE